MQSLPVLDRATATPAHATLGELRRYALRPHANHPAGLLAHLTHCDTYWRIA